METKTGRKKQLILIVCMLMILAATGCADKAADAGNAAATSKITANWEVYSWSVDGVTTYRQEGDDANHIPQFTTADGVNFTFTVTGETVYDGTIIENDDGSYSLKHGDNPNLLTAKVEDDTLTIWVSEETTIVFKEKK